MYPPLEVLHIEFVGNVNFIHILEQKKTTQWVAFLFIGLFINVRVQIKLCLR